MLLEKVNKGAEILLPVFLHCSGLRANKIYKSKYICVNGTKQFAVQEYAIEILHVSFFCLRLIIIDVNYLHSYWNTVLNWIIAGPI